MRLKNLFVCFGVNASNEESRDVFILRVLRNFEFFHFARYFLSQGVVHSVVSIFDSVFKLALPFFHGFDILISDIIMSIRTRFASIALTLHKETANMSLISVIALGTESSCMTIRHFLQCSDDFWLVIRQVQLLNASVHIVRPVVTISNVFRHFNYFLVRNKFVT